jgi:pyruvate dehydrogenase E2 component (dihydrolipoamide acetyltransferase)
MAEKVQMTALSPTMEEGTIVTWNKSEGDSVSPGDLLCEVETDKATMDYESTQDGTLLKIVRGEGESAAVGDIIAILGEEGEDIDDLVKEAEEAGSGAAESTEATEKAPAAPGEDESSTAEKPSSAKQAAPTEADRAKSQPTGEAGIVKASPLARKLADQRGIALSDVQGSGPGGRVVKRDIESYEARPSEAAAAGAGEYGRPALAPGEDRTIPVTGKRAVIAKRLAESKFTAPHYYVKASADMAGVIAGRNALNAELPEKASFNAFIIKLAAEALKKHPNVNASWEGDVIREFGSIDIGLAVDVGNGLITPIVRNCGNKGVVAIDGELKELIQKARDGKLVPEEYTGATFTVSNLGSFGIEEFTAIINPPGSAILALGETKKQPIVGENDEISIRPIMKMSLSCDHRVIDGAAGGRFLHDLVRIIENPIRVLY